MKESPGGRSPVIGTATQNLDRKLGAALALLLIVLLAGASSASGAGAKLVRDIAPEGRSSQPRGLTPAGDNLFFRADDRVHGPELWRSDGSRVGTKLVKDIRPGRRGSYPRRLESVGGMILFAADDGVHGSELWRSDGTKAGTQMVSDIYPGAEGSGPTQLTNVGGTLFFVAHDGTHGYELWRSYGSEGGTELVRDILPGSEPSSPPYSSIWNPTSMDGMLFFLTEDGIHGWELWRSDGTEGGTELVRDIVPGGEPSDVFEGPSWLTSAGGTLFFVLDDLVHGEELWRSDGTDAGTFLLDIRPGGPNSHSLAAPLWSIGGEVIFTPNDGTHGYEPWRSDGTEAGTKLYIADTPPGPPDLSPQSFARLDGTLWFTNFKGLGRTNGSVAGTKLVRKVEPYVGLTKVAGTLFFTAYTGRHNVELWSSNGTRSGTQLVRDIWPGSKGSAPQHLTAVGGTLFFSAEEGHRRHGTELWKAVP